MVMVNMNAFVCTKFLILYATASLHRPGRCTYFGIDPLIHFSGFSFLSQTLSDIFWLSQSESIKTPSRTKNCVIILRRT